jgi:hypothetical protein
MRHPFLDGILAKPSVNYFEEHPLFGHHVYATPTDELYTGCTTVAGAWDKSSFLAPWYAKETVKELGWFDEYEEDETGKKVKKSKEKLLDEKLELEARFEKLKTLDSKDYYKILQEAKGAGRRKGAEAGDQGTEAHEFFKEFVSSKIDPTFQISMSAKSPQAINAVKAFLEWEPKQDVQWLAGEEVINSNKYKIAGRLDALGNYNGLSSILDFKTSGQLGPGYILQLGGYSIMLEEMGFPVRQWVIIRTPKDGKKVETLTIRNLELMDFAKKTFLQIREAHKFFVYVENHMVDPVTKKLRVDIPIEELKVVN